MFSPAVYAPANSRFITEPILSQKKPSTRSEKFSAALHLSQVVPASHLEVRPAPERVSSGIRELDELTGGFPRGCLTEICGPASSGGTSILLAALAAATRRQEICALVDVSDALDPLSAAAAGMDFERLLWVRCGTAISPHRHTDFENQKTPFRSPALSPAGREISRRRSPSGPKQQTSKHSKEDPIAQALRATDLLLQSGGFGLIAMDLSGIPFQEARRIPLASWFRFQRAVEPTPTVLFVLAQQPLAQTCAALLMKIEVSKLPARENFPTHARLLDRLDLKSEVLRSRVERKPAHSVTAFFASKVLHTG